MRTLYTAVALVALLVAGCTIERGNFDFADPWFDVQCGPVTLIAFRSSTVLKIGTTYLTLSLPFYAPIIFILVLVALLWFTMRLRQHRPASPTWRIG